MKDQHSHLEIALASIDCFADDGRLDAGELDKLVSIAERDGSINAEEARVLQRIVGRIQPGEIDAAMASRLDALAARLAPPERN